MTYIPTLPSQIIGGRTVVDSGAPSGTLKIVWGFTGTSSTPRFGFSNGASGASNPYRVTSGVGIRVVGVMVHTTGGTQKQINIGYNDTSIAAAGSATAFTNWVAGLVNGTAETAGVLKGPATSGINYYSCDFVVPVNKYPVGQANGADDLMTVALYCYEV